MRACVQSVVRIQGILPSWVEGRWVSRYRDKGGESFPLNSERSRADRAAAVFDVCKRSRSRTGFSPARSPTPKPAHSGTFDPTCIDNNWNCQKQPYNWRSRSGDPPEWHDACADTAKTNCQKHQHRSAKSIYMYTYGLTFDRRILPLYCWTIIIIVTRRFTLHARRIDV